MSDNDTFDYVIVGGGTAGCILTRRLTEDGKATVCLIEAGPQDKSPLIHMPLGFVRMLFEPKYNWMFMGPPDPNMKNRPTFAPRGKTLGGSSSINGMIYMRGQARDYDEWASFGNSGWGWDDMLPYMRKSVFNENYKDGKLHDQKGELHVKYLEEPNKLNHVFVEAAQSLQKKKIPDFNAGDNEGFSIFQVTISNGRRTTAATAPHPIENKPDLKIVTGRRWGRSENGRATGVRFSVGGKTRRIKVRKSDPLGRRVPVAAS
jgi:choline dehydrogenase